VVLTSQIGKDCLVSAGTGSGKTLLIAPNVLLDNPLKNLVTLVLSPLKRLQVTQETDFNSWYGIPAVVINEDTPREDAWWVVSRASWSESAQVNLTEVHRITSGTTKSTLLDMLGFLLSLWNNSLGLVRVIFLASPCFSKISSFRNILYVLSSTRRITSILLA
jgi:hypothetical protein